MNHLKWMGHSATIYDIHKTLRADQQSCDVRLVGKGHFVLMHRFVLCACSDLLRSMLADLPNDQETTIIVPDIKGIVLESVLEFVYLGEVCLTSSNLSDFLEAINFLGIKSAISFECNTTALAADISTEIPMKSIGDIQIAQIDEFIEEDNNIETAKLQTQTEIPESTTTRGIQFLDMYGEHQPQHKITYSIEHLPGANSTNEYILTETSGTFTLTPQEQKLENSSNSESDRLADIIEDDEEADTEPDDSQIIEEYSSNTDPIIEVTGESSPVIISAGIPTTSIAAPIASSPALQTKLKAVKLKPTCTNIGVSTKKEEMLDFSLKYENNSVDCSSLNINVDDPIAIVKSDNLYTKYTSTSDSALDMAVKAVIEEGQSLQKASQRYEISKTVLWRRVRKNPNYMKAKCENPVLKLAYERIKDGESLKNISRDLDIPMSTLHRHKVRLAQQGSLPAYVTVKKRDQNSKQSLKIKLEKAVRACVHDGMTQNHAANLYEIPKSTLWRHLQKRVAEAELLEIESNRVKEEVILS